MTRSQRTQDGWLWTADQEIYLHASTLAEALEAAADQTCDEFEGEGWVEIYRAYRVDLASIALTLAEDAVRLMGNGALETAYVESVEELDEIQDRLRQAFAADIERVCGPWHEVLGSKGVLSIRFDDGIVGHIDGDPAVADEAASLGWHVGTRIDGGES